MVLTLFLNLLQQPIPEPAAAFATSFASPALAFESLRHFSPENLSRLLDITAKTARRATTSNSHRCLELLLNVLRVASQAFATQNGREILAVLNAMLTSHASELTCIGLLNVVGELAKKSREPSWFLEHSPISFQTIVPLFVSETSSVRQRAIGIVAMVMLGSVQTVDLRLVFSSLMSLFVGKEGGSAGYVTMAGNLMEIVASCPVRKEHLELLGPVFAPMASLGDAACSVAVAGLLNFLKKVAQTGEEDVGVLAMELMVEFAGTGQGFVARK
jgi:hypothetical protein